MFMYVSSGVSSQDESKRESKESQEISHSKDILQSHMLSIKTCDGGIAKDCYKSIKSFYQPQSFSPDAYGYSTTKARQSTQGGIDNTQEFFRRSCDLGHYLVCDVSYKYPR